MHEPMYPFIEGTLVSCLGVLQQSSMKCEAPDCYICQSICILYMCVAAVIHQGRIQVYISVNPSIEKYSRTLNFVNLGQASLQTIQW